MQAINRIRLAFAVAITAAGVVAAAAGSWAPAPLNAAIVMAARPVTMNVVAIDVTTDGVAVYQLPSINVVGSRSALVAEIAREDAGAAR